MTLQREALRRARRAVCAAAGVAVAVAITSTAQADTLRWINATGGFYDDGANWDLGVGPSDLDDVVFDLATAYTVDFRLPGFANLLRAEAGEIEFNLAGFDKSATFISVAADAAQDARVTFRDGRVYTPFGMSVGTGAGAYGEVRFSGPSAFGDMENGDTHTIGRIGELGSASLGVDAGGRLDVGFIDIHGEALVTGAGSLFRAREANITGRMAFEDGASSSTEVWNVTGELAVTDSAVTAELFLGASNLTLTRGTINATLAVGVDLSTVTINESAAVDAAELSMVGGTLNLAINAQSFSAGGPLLSAFFRGNVENNALEVSFLDGYSPLAGQQLHLLSIADDSTGAFRDPFSSLQATGLAPGLAAQIDIVPLNGFGGYDAYLTFVPSPSTALLFAMGAPALIRRRRA